MPPAAEKGAQGRAVLLARGIRLELATLAWNVVGVGVVFAAAFAAGSVALAGFGLDTAIEILASTVVIWHLRDTGDERRERRALLVIGWAFVGLAIYVTAQALYTLIVGDHPHHSPLGIGWTAATFVAMLALARAKGATGKALGNVTLETESRVTMVDAYLAGAVLVGLVLNAAHGWWWADPLAGLVVVYYAVREAGAAFAEVRG
ncbi:MAG: cation transporter [Solirubrobacterales bacterium 70-9]|nr:MAG: cation transporter [Solirubrobacterales bacterium 70-9]